MILNYNANLIQKVVNETNKSVVGFIVVSFLFVYLYLDYIPLVFMILWFIAQSVFIFYRYKIAKKFIPYLRENNTLKIRKNTKSFFLVTIGSALILDFGIVLGALYAPSPYEFVSLLLIAGIIAAGTLTLLPIFYIFIIYSFLLLAPQVLILLYFGTKAHIAALGMLLLYIPLIFSLARSIYKNLLASLESTAKLEKHISLLHELSITDSLTKIYNRRFFLECSDNYITTSKREKTDISLLILDIDYFKKINDKYGHQTGDLILIEFVKLTKQQLRQSDIMARIGGEEFAILLPNTSLEGAKNISQKICQIIKEKEFLIKNNTINFTISIGAGMIDKNHNTFDELFHEADVNLYEAKKLGRNRVVA